VPVRHFGAILPWDDWHRLADRLKRAGTSFIIEPHIRFKGEVGEQATMFFLDPSGNALEFKSFQDPSQVFARGARRVVSGREADAVLLSSADDQRYSAAGTEA
jgi:hypothetical protein